MSLCRIDDWNWVLVLTIRRLYIGLKKIMLNEKNELKHVRGYDWEISIIVYYTYDYNNNRHYHNNMNYHIRHNNRIIFKLPCEQSQS